MANGNGTTAPPELYGAPLVDVRTLRASGAVAPDYGSPVGLTPAGVRAAPCLSPIARLAAEQGLPDLPPLKFPPWLYPPFGVRGVDEPQNRLPVVIAVGASLAFPWPVVPAGVIGVVRKIGVTLTAGAATDLAATTRINGQAVAPWGRAQGALGDVLTPPELIAPVIVPPGAVFDVFIENVGIAAITVAVRMQGWWY